MKIYGVILIFFYSTFLAGANTIALDRQSENDPERIINKDFSKKHRGIFTYKIEELDALMLNALAGKTTVKESEFEQIFQKCYQQYLEKIPEHMVQIHHNTDDLLKYIHALIRYTVFRLDT